MCLGAAGAVSLPGIDQPGGEEDQRVIQPFRTIKETQMKTRRYHLHRLNRGRWLLRRTAELAGWLTGRTEARANEGTNFLGTAQQTVSAARGMPVLLGPRILLLGIDPTEIIRGTGQDLCRRKLITGLFITWKKLETTQPADSPGRRKTN